MVIEMRNSEGEIAEIERPFYIPRAWQNEQGYLRSDLCKTWGRILYLLQDCEETAACFKPWGSIMKTYTPLYIEYVM